VPEANVSRETIVGALFRRRLRKQDICRRAGQLAPVPLQKYFLAIALNRLRISFWPAEKPAAAKESPVNRLINRTRRRAAAQQ
jgi:hypothetical protein